MLVAVAVSAWACGFVAGPTAVAEAVGSPPPPVGVAGDGFFRFFRAPASDTSAIAFGIAAEGQSETTIGLESANAWSTVL